MRHLQQTIDDHKNMRKCATKLELDPPFKVSQCITKKLIVQMRECHETTPPTCTMAGKPEGTTVDGEIIDADSTDRPTAPPIASLPTTGSSIMCTEQCKLHKGKRSGRSLDIIQCSACAEWFHIECVGLKKDATVGILPCSRCSGVFKEAYFYKHKKSCLSPQKRVNACTCP